MVGVVGACGLWVVGLWGVNVWAGIFQAGTAGPSIPIPIPIPTPIFGRLPYT